MANEHERLQAFIGDWWAEGTAFGADREGGPWRSVHTARWHAGEQFVVQDEHAKGPFDTLSFLGWDRERETYFSWSIENHGFNREYLVTVDGDEWTLTGDQERATITCSRFYPGCAEKRSVSRSGSLRFRRTVSARSAAACRAIVDVASGCAGNDR